MLYLGMTVKQKGKNGKEYKETHQEGRISIENLPKEFGLSFSPAGRPFMEGDFGIQIAKDGRVWVCINGLAFLRFSPHPDGKMMKGR